LLTANGRLSDSPPPEGIGTHGEFLERSRLLSTLLYSVAVLIAFGPRSGIRSRAYARNDRPASAEASDPAARTDRPRLARPAFPSLTLAATMTIAGHDAPPCHSPPLPRVLGFATPLSPAPRSTVEASGHTR
jgi:hypothetical protein